MLREYEKNKLKEIFLDHAETSLRHHKRNKSNKYNKHLRIRTGK